MDAQAPYAEERRGKLRKATGSRKQAQIRRYLNGETRQVKNLSPMTESIGHEEGTRGTETSKYPQEKKVTTIPRVEAIERGTAQTGGVMRRVPGL